eukprot:3505037-Amphidinium_carterae.2
MASVPCLPILSIVGLRVANPILAQRDYDVHYGGLFTVSSVHSVDVHVCKKQSVHRIVVMCTREPITKDSCLAFDVSVPVCELDLPDGSETVSYTHLTLPTILLV